MTTNTMEQLARQISEKKRFLSEINSKPLNLISKESISLINEPDKLDQYLYAAIGQLPHCTLLYVTDRYQRQLSSCVSADDIKSEYRGQDLSKRPYLQETIPLKGLILSNLYQSDDSSKTCISLVQAIQTDGYLLGFLIADFNLNDLPLPNDIAQIMSRWKQFKGDPVIRGSLFSQKRVISQMDTHIKKVHANVHALMLQNGVFHFKLHYSSSRVTLWLYDEPHNYRLHSVDDLLSQNIFTDYPERDYPDTANIDAHKLRQVLNQFRALRFADENIYLRSGSVNIINGMVGLNFSCDGSHYIPVHEFIENSMEYWLGNMKTA